MSSDTPRFTALWPALSEFPAVRDGDTGKLYHAAGMNAAEALAALLNDLHDKVKP